MPQPMRSGRFGIGEGNHGRGGLEAGPRRSIRTTRPSREIEQKVVSNDQTRPSTLPDQSHWRYYGAICGRSDTLSASPRETSIEDLARIHARLQDVLHLANIYLSHSSRLLAMVYRMSKVLRARTAEHVILRSLHSTRVNPAFTSLSEPGGDDEGMDWEVRQRHRPLVSRCVAEEVYVTT